MVAHASHQEPCCCLYNHFLFIKIDRFYLRNILQIFNTYGFGVEMKFSGKFWIGRDKLM